MIINTHLNKIFTIIGIIIGAAMVSLCFYNFIAYYHGNAADQYWWANFGQSFGFSAALLSFLSILIILYTIREQSVQNREQDDRQKLKISILQEQLQNSSELDSLDIFIKSQFDFIEYYSRESDKNNYDDDQRAEFERDIQNRHLFIKNCVHELSFKSNKTFTGDSKLTKDLFWKPEDGQCSNSYIIRKEIATHLGVPIPAIITRIQEKEIPEGENERIEYLKKIESPFAKWINDAYSAGTNNSAIDLIKKDIEHYYRVKTHNFYIKVEKKSALYADLHNNVREKLAGNNPNVYDFVLQKSQIAILCLKRPSNKNELADLVWPAANNDFKVFSDFQVDKYGDSICNCINNHRKNYWNKVSGFACYTSHIKATDIFENEILQHFYEKRISNKTEILKNLKPNTFNTKDVETCVERMLATLGPYLC